MLNLENFNTFTHLHIALNSLKNLYFIQLPNIMKQLFVTILITSFLTNILYSQDSYHNYKFVENKGQVVDQFGHPNNNVLFLSNLPNLKVSLRNNGFSYEVSQMIAEKNEQNISIRNQRSRKLENYRIDFVFDKVDKVIAENEDIGITNFITNNQEITDVKSFQTIKYLNVWDNIDIEFNIENSPTPRFKYNFILHNGAKIEDINFRIKSDKLPIIESNKIKINTPFGDIEEKIPVSYLLNNNTRSQQFVDVNYTISDGNKIGVQVPNSKDFDLINNKLVIDPTPDLLWGTYYGGNNIDIGSSISTDNNGNIFMAGATASANNISTIGVYQSALLSYVDGFVTKFNSNGGRLWATYYGGNDATFINKISADNAGGVFILGDTYSTTNISSTAPIVGYQPNHGNPGGIDCFLARLNTSGGRQWGTYFGGGMDDYSYGISTDATAVYIVGETASNNNISTANAHKTAITGGTDGFIAKFNYSGSLTWGTYYGGDGGDAVKGVALDKNGNVCIGGNTNSTAGISTANTHQVAISADIDGFVAKLNNAGVRQWGTYYGGSNLENITSVSVDTAGNVFCAGSTQSSSGISSNCVHQYYAPSYISSSEAPFLFCINGQTGKRNWGTYFGPESTFITSIMGDKKGNLYFAGQAFLDGIGTTGALKVNITGESDGFVAKINRYGLLEWGSYYGGDGDIDQVNGIFVDASNQLFLTGSTSSTNNIATSGAYQIINGGNPVDAFISKLRDTLPNKVVPSIVTSAVSNILGSCLGVSTGKATASGSGGNTPYSYLWSNGETSQNAIKLPNGTVSVTVSDLNGCFSVTTVTIPSLPTPTAYAGPDVTICSGSIANLNATGGGSYLWSNGVNTASNPVQPTALTSYRVTVTGSNGCYSVDTVLVRVNPVPIANAGADTTVCQGRSARLRATGGITYKWSTNQTLQEIIVTPLITTTYTVTVTGQNTCTATDVVIVNVNPIPIANAGANKILCNGSSVDITATGGSTYIWNTGQSESTIKVSPTVSTNYIVTVSNGNCFAMDTVLVEVVPLPKANAGFDQTICVGSEATLIATGGTNYLWSTGENTSTIKVSPTSSINYEVTVYSSNGCKSFDTVNVKVNPLPDAKAGLSFSSCQNIPFQLKATGGVNYKWSNGSNTDTTTIVENTSGLKFYFVTVTDANGCSASDQISVNILNAPIVNLISESTICNGQTISLNSNSNANSFLWSNGETTNSISISPLSTETYSVTATGSNGCKTIASAKINVLPKPIANAGNDIGICLGSQANLKASGGVSYLWSTGENTDAIQVSPVVTTSYYVTVSNGNCSDFDTVQVVVKPLPIAYAGVDQTICRENTAKLEATGGINYLWSNGSTGSPINVSPSTTTIYTVTVTDLNGCQSTDAVILTVNSLPNANAGSDQTICQGASANLIASGGVSYIWNNGVNQANNVVSPTVSTKYFVQVTDINGCSAIDTVLVKVNPLPTAFAGDDRAICVGWNSTINATGGIKYTWSNGSTANQIIVSPTVTTTYVVTVEDVNGCKASDSVTVLVRPLPIVDLGVDTIKLFVGQSTTLDAKNVGSTYLWSNGATTQKLLVIDPSQQYCVTVTDNFGCSSSDCVYVKFTPNQLSEIENWSVKIFPNPTTSLINIIGNRNLNNATIQIFTIEGKLVYSKVCSGDSFTFDLVDYPNGSYQLIINELGKTNSYTLLLQKN